MFFNVLFILVLYSFIRNCFCFNALLISTGHAGHAIPLFELAKELKNHNVTFLTQALAQSFIDFNSVSNSSLFRVIYSNDSAEALIEEKEKMQELISYSANHSFFDSQGYTSKLMSQDLNTLFSKTVHLLMTDQFDVIIINSLLKPIRILGQQIHVPCVIQGTETFPDMLDFNLPNSFSLLSREQMTRTKYRLYNLIYTLRVGVTIITKLLPVMSTMAQAFPKVPGPFYDSFSLANLFSTKSKCLELYNLPPTFHIPTYPTHYTKYLGAFIDESNLKSEESDLTKWVDSKGDGSIIYGAFGTSSLIKEDRMKNLINGLAEFLFQTPQSFLILAFGARNHRTYRTMLNELNNQAYFDILTNDQRVRVENQFVEQKWILQQNSIKLFLSHCGMGSCSESIYFHKPILCMPFNMDQFINSITIDQLAIGLSLFVPPSLFQSLLHPHHFHDYTFSPESVTKKLLAIWKNNSYENKVQFMSMEMKYAGGVKRAVEEVEFLVRIKGDLDRYAPFQTTLPFYQRYLLDLILIFVILPIVIISYGLRKCCKGRRKLKDD